MPRSEERKKEGKAWNGAGPAPRQRCRNSDGGCAPMGEAGHQRHQGLAPVGGGRMGRREERLRA